MAEAWEPIVFPEHVLLIVGQRLREQQAEGVRMPEGMPLDELALRTRLRWRRADSAQGPRIVEGGQGQRPESSSWAAAGQEP
jgi:hypothetical protein